MKKQLENVQKVFHRIRESASSIFLVLGGHGRSSELEKSDFRNGSKSGPPLIRFYHGNDHFGARRV